MVTDAEIAKGVLAYKKLSDTAIRITKESGVDIKKMTPSSLNKSIEIIIRLGENNQPLDDKEN